MTKRLKLTLMLCCIFSINLSLAEQVNPLMKCLGMEELAIHKKKVYGPVYKLNQHFINEFATLYGLTLKDESLQRICKEGSFSPSVNLLQELLIRGRSSFYIPATAKSGGVDALATSSLDGFLEKVPHVFFDYLSQLQAMAPIAPCLENNIPEIKYFMERYKYLEDVTGTRAIVDQEEVKIISIFSKLKRFDKILKKCEEAKKKKK